MISVSNLGRKLFSLYLETEIPSLFRDGNGDRIFPSLIRDGKFRLYFRLYIETE